jgi:hypothetical protein
MYCVGGHLGFPIDIKNINFVADLPMIIPGQVGLKENVQMPSSQKLQILLKPNCT